MALIETDMQELTSADIDLLRSQQDLIHAPALKAMIAFLAVITPFLFVVAGGAIYLLLTDSYNFSQRDAGGPLVVLAFIAGCITAGSFYASRLLRIPRGRRGLTAAVQGLIPKKIVTGTLSSIEPSFGKGVCYVFGDERVDVAVLGHNAIYVNTNYGQRPISTQALTGRKVTLHLLQLYPHQQPLLLACNYAGVDEAIESIAPLSPQDRRLLARNDTHAVRWLTFMIGGAIAVSGLIHFSLIIVAFGFAVIAVTIAVILLLPHKPALSQTATDKRVLCGTLTEALTYRVVSGAVTPTGASTLSTNIVRAYRIGSRLCPVARGSVTAELGEIVTYEYVRDKPLTIPLPIRLGGVSEAKS